MFIRTAKTNEHAFGKVLTHTKWPMDLEEYRGQNLDVWTQWMALHTCSKGDLIQMRKLHEIAQNTISFTCNLIKHQLIQFVYVRLQQIMTYI